MATFENNTRAKSSCKKIPIVGRSMGEVAVHNDNHMDCLPCLKIIDNNQMFINE